MKQTQLIAVVIAALILISCSDTPTETTGEVQPEPGQFPDMASFEQTLINLAEVLPEVLTNEELAHIVYQEAKQNAEDEPYALWSSIADIPASNGKTLRSEVGRIRSERTRGKTTGSNTSEFDSLDYLQVFIVNYELWDGESTLPSTFTPLTVNDVDVTELTAYDTLGYDEILYVSNDDWEPDYSMAIVGINETGRYEADGDTGYVYRSTVADSGIYMHTIYVRRPRSLEPWWKGKAEMVVRKLDTDCGGAGANAPVRNKKNCNKKRSGRYSINGIWQGSLKLTGNAETVDIQVFEFDWISSEWIINQATLNYSVWNNWDLTVTDAATWYYCGTGSNKKVRCSYYWTWGTDDSHIYCSDN